MKTKNKILSLLLVIFMLVVNSLTACGQYPNTQAEDRLADTETETAQGRETSNLEDAEAYSESAKNPEKHKDDGSEKERNVTDAPPAVDEKAVQLARSYPEKESAPVFRVQVSEEAKPQIPVSIETEVPQPGNIIEIWYDESEDEIPDDWYPVQQTVPAMEEPEPAEQHQETETIEEQLPSHAHAYSANTIPPTCATAGYTQYTCACGDSYITDEVAALGHDWQTNSEKVLIGQQAHEICGDCGADLTANGISGAAIAQHAKQHVMADEGATGRTYTTMIDTYSEVITCKCSRCGEIQ